MINWIIWKKSNLDRLIAPRIVFTKFVNLHCMRTMFFCALLLLCLSQTFAQQTTPSQPLSQQDYLKKSKSQKTAAWIMLGGGLALDIAAAAWGASHWNSSGPDFLFVIGSASMLGSIPLFIASSKNKKRAAKATTYLELQKVPAVTLARISFRSSPTLSLKITF